MADWSALRSALRNVGERRTFTWHELDSMIGGLPASAYKYPAFWSGARTGWPGFITTDVRVGGSVTFVRASSTAALVPHVSPKLREGDIRPREKTEVECAPVERADVVLVGCVKSKREHAAPAKDLYTSALFHKERDYAEAAGGWWFILSAEHGLVAPDEVLQPYELRLATTSRGYRDDWGLRVVQQLQRAVGPLRGKTIEVHAGSAYADPIRAGLTEAGAHVVEPLAGLALGQRLAWYGSHTGQPQAQATTTVPTPAVADLVTKLRDEATSQSPAEFLATDGAGFRIPGLYSWWVDSPGAHDLATGLGHTVEPGLIYAGLAGATRSRSGMKSTNTLWGRICGMHLGGRNDFSTFRLSLGSILASAHGHDEIDEGHLTMWMHQHLRVIAIPVEDADALNSLETGILAILDPPLNLDKRPKNEVRSRLSELRRRHNRK